MHFLLAEHAFLVESDRMSQPRVPKCYSKGLIPGCCSPKPTPCPRSHSRMLLGRRSWYVATSSYLSVTCKTFLIRCKLLFKWLAKCSSYAVTCSSSDLQHVPGTLSHLLQVNCKVILLRSNMFVKSLEIRSWYVVTSSSAYDSMIPTLQNWRLKLLSSSNPHRGHPIWHRTW